MAKVHGATTEELEYANLLRRSVAPYLAEGMARMLEDHPKDPARYLSDFLSQATSSSPSTTATTTMAPGEDTVALLHEREMLQREMAALDAQLAEARDHAHGLHSRTAKLSLDEQQRIADQTCWREIKRYKRLTRSIKVRLAEALDADDFALPEGVVLVVAAPGVDAACLCAQFAQDFGAAHLPLNLEPILREPNIQSCSEEASTIDQLEASSASPAVALDAAAEVQAAAAPLAASAGDASAQITPLELLRPFAWVEREPPLGTPAQIAGIHAGDGIVVFGGSHDLNGLTEQLVADRPVLVVLQRVDGQLEQVEVLPRVFDEARPAALLGCQLVAADADWRLERVVHRIAIAFQKTTLVLVEMGDSPASEFEDVLSELADGGVSASFVLALTCAQDTIYRRLLSQQGEENDATREIADGIARVWVGTELPTLQTQAKKAKLPFLTVDCEGDFETCMANFLCAIAGT
uniref:Uncharacterized protein n=2 Tax=Chrysotila carterae TaxID=13221 RepID=A0A7S4FAM7_CHRCT